MRDSKSLRPGMLMHSKMMFVRGKANKGNSKIAWAYVGSANLSESACEFLSISVPFALFAMFIPVYSWWPSHRVETPLIYYTLLDAKV